jgi:hypothetical protein
VVKCKARLIANASRRRRVLAVLFLAIFAVCCRKVHEESSFAQTHERFTEMPQSAFDFVNSIGVNTHLNYFDRIYGNFPLVEQELKSIGILHLRDGAHLQNDDYNQALYTRWIKLGNLGIRFDAVLDPRSNLGPLNAALLSRIDALSGHTIESFEGPNELDISNIKDWPSVDRDFDRELFDSTRSIANASHIKVFGPSLAFASHSPQLGDLSEHIDVANIHPYPAGKMPSVVFPEQVDLAKVMAGGKPIVFTESGYHNALDDHRGQPGVSETAAAKYIPRLFLEDFTHGVMRTYLYEFMDEAPDPGLTDAELHWGLLRADGSEKPAFLAMKNLIAELSDSAEPAQLRHIDWALSSADPHIHDLLLEKSNGVFDLIFWQEISSYDVPSQTDIENPSLHALLTLDRRASKITLYDPVRQAEPVGSYRNAKSVPLAIPDEPLVVEIRF